MNTTMQTKHDKDPLACTIGKRLRAARIAAKLHMSNVAERLGYQNQTQVCLAETGVRVPPLPYLIQYAKLYVVPLDFLCGLTNDPIADTAETNQAIIATAIADAMQEQFTRLVSSVSGQASVTIAGYNQDLRDLKAACLAARQASTALERVRELNPEFDEDWRGTAKLVSRLEAIADLAATVTERHDRERSIRNALAGELSLDDMTGTARKIVARLSMDANNC